MDLDPGLSGPAVRGSMLVQPYLFFDGRCEEALEFYASALGAEVTMVMRYRDAPDPPPPGMIAPGSEGKIMHASFRLGETIVMASDGRCGGQLEFKGFSLSLTVASEAVVHGSGVRAQCPLPRSGLIRCGRTPGVPAPACGSGPGPPRPSQSPDAHPYASAARPRSRA